MNHNDDPVSDDPMDVDWAELRSLYRAEASSLARRPRPTSSSSRGRSAIRTIAMAAIGFAVVVLPILGGLDPVQIALAGLMVPAWLFALSYDVRGRGRRRRQQSSDTEAFLREDGRWLARQGRVWRWVSVFLTVGSVITLLRGGTELLELSTRAHASVGEFTQWIGFLLGVAAMLWVARVRSARLARETEIHADLEREHEHTDSHLVIPLSQSRVVLLASLVVVGLLGAVLSWALPDDADDQIFGKSDSPQRILVVSDDGEALGRFIDGLGFQSTSMTRKAMIETLELDGEDGDAQLTALLAHADHQGFGFVVIDLESFDPGLEQREDLLMPSQGRSGGDRFAALSIGDLTYAGPELSYGGAEDVPEMGPRIRARIGLTRALFSQPVMVDVSEGRSPLLFTPAFLTDAVREMDRMETQLERGQVPPRWDVD